MKYAYLENHCVKEIVQGNPHQLFSPSYAALFVVVPDEVQQGWVATEGVFDAPPVVTPPVVVPQSVSPRQIRQALSRAGLRTSLESAVAMSDQDTKDWYEFATEFERASPVVAAMGAALGVTDAQLDGLWTLAATL